MSQPETTDAYGRYILGTQGDLEELELAYGRYFYRRFFEGHSPVLDLGPGRCWFLRQNPGTIWGVDSSAEIVAAYSRQGYQLRRGTAYEIPFDDGFFGGVFCCWLFEHLDDPDRAMSEIKRVLRPNGIACIVVPTPQSLMKGFYDDYTHLRPFTKTSLAHLSHNHGLEVNVCENLPWVRGLKVLLRHLGRLPADRYVDFGDRALRRLRLVNRMNLTLLAVKGRN